MAGRPGEVCDAAHRVSCVLIFCHVDRSTWKNSVSLSVNLLVGGHTVPLPRSKPPPLHKNICSDPKKQMSTRTFEGVLHPVFQEEETTLIIAGAILGAIAGFLQMLLSTKGVRDAAKKAAALAAEKASAAVRKADAILPRIYPIQYAFSTVVCWPSLLLDLSGKLNYRVF